MMNLAIKPAARSRATSIRDDLKMVLRDVEEVTGVSARDLMGRSRVTAMSDARQLAYLCLRSRRHACASVAKAMNKLDHGTVSHGCRRISDLAKIEKKTAMRVDEMRHRGYAI
jgi:chromosomal replication initiation ATPase DnaA